MKPRTRARGTALQVLFEIDIAGHALGTVLEERIAESDLEDKLAEFTRQIVTGVVPLSERLDHFIAQHAPDWPLDQIAIIDRNILRIALWEIAVSDQTPMKVAINEAIELGKTFGSESTPRFVNGVLGSLAARQAEIQQAFRKLGS